MISIWMMVRVMMTVSWSGCALCLLCQSVSMGADHVLRVVRWSGCRSGRVMGGVCGWVLGVTGSFGCCEHSVHHGYHRPPLIWANRRHRRAGLELALLLSPTL